MRILFISALMALLASCTPAAPVQLSEPYQANEYKVRFFEVLPDANAAKPVRADEIAEFRRDLAFFLMDRFKATPSHPTEIGVTVTVSKVEVPDLKTDGWADMHIQLWDFNSKEPIGNFTVQYMGGVQNGGITRAGFMSRSVTKKVPVHERKMHFYTTISDDIVKQIFPQ